MTKFDRTSPVHRMVFDVRKSWELRRRWREHFDELAKEYGLSRDEARAVRDGDLVQLHALGVHPFYYNPIIRLTHGEDWDEFQPATVEIMKRTYGSVADPQSYATSSTQGKG